MFGHRSASAAESRSLQFAGAEPAVRSLAGQHRVDPAAGLADDRFILEHVAQVAVALEPIGQFLPAALAFALLVGPSAVVELQPGRDFGQPAGHALGFQFQHVPQPALGRDAADGQFHQRAGPQRISIRRIQAVAVLRRNLCHRTDVFWAPAPAAAPAHKASKTINAAGRCLMVIIPFLEEPRFSFRRAGRCLRLQVCTLEESRLDVN